MLMREKHSCSPACTAGEVPWYGTTCLSGKLSHDLFCPLAALCLSAVLGDPQALHSSCEQLVWDNLCVADGISVGDVWGCAVGFKAYSLKTEFQGKSYYKTARKCWWRKAWRGRRREMSQQAEHLAEYKNADFMTLSPPVSAGKATNMSPNQLTKMSNRNMEYI